MCDGNRLHCGRYIRHRNALHLAQRTAARVTGPTAGEPDACIAWAHFDSRSAGRLPREQLLRYLHRSLDRWRNNLVPSGSPRALCGDGLQDRTPHHHIPCFDAIGPERGIGRQRCADAFGEKAKGMDVFEFPSIRTGYLHGDRGARLVHGLRYHLHSRLRADEHPHTARQRRVDTVRRVR